MAPKSPFEILHPKSDPVPILISVPHCGVQFPDEIAGSYDQRLIAEPDDTDWYVDQLYDFATEMGITLIRSVYSRWVIDLNRDPESKPLYDDGRIITALVPETDFKGAPLYRNLAPDAHEIERRMTAYYLPYHHMISTLLTDLKSKFKRVLLWEAHSIRQQVPTIHPEQFPDLILGDADGQSSDADLIESALSTLGSGGYQLTHNDPFKGGYITRKFWSAHPWYKRVAVGDDQSELHG